MKMIKTFKEFENAVDTAATYTQYIAENLDKSIDYAEYIAENLDNKIYYGPQGASGVSGVSGISGFSGPQGFAGTTGFSGPQGIVGKSSLYDLYEKNKIYTGSTTLTINNPVLPTMLEDFKIVDKLNKPETFKDFFPTYAEMHTLYE